MVFITPVQLTYQRIPGELLLPPVIHILFVSAMVEVPSLGPPAFRSGHLLGPELWGVFVTKKRKVCIAVAARGSGALGHLTDGKTCQESE